MRVVMVTRNGGPEVLEVAEREAPLPGVGEVLVDVAAAGVNFMDIYQREGRPPYDAPPPFVPGAEGAGTVATVGSGVDDVAVGDRVAWAGLAKSYAEQVIVPADRVVPVLDGVDLYVAAAVMVQGLTAHYLANTTYPVSRGDTVVVHAAAGGVGLLLTQIVKSRGGVVVGTTSTAEKAELARQAGADHVTDYGTFAAVVREVSGGTGAAVVYDGVGKSTFEAGLTALRRRGYMVLYGAASGPVPPFELQRLAAAGSLYVTRPLLAHHIATRDELRWRADQLFGWIRDGTLAVRIGGTYPLDQASRAHEDLGARRTTGKLLLVPR